MTTEGFAGTPPAAGAFSRLTATQCERLHEATLRVLERTGLLVEEPEALELLRRAGAEVDEARVRLGARLVDWALSVAPRSVTLYDREGLPAMILDGRNTCVDALRNYDSAPTWRCRPR